MTSTPTILQIIPELETGGAELSTIEIAEAVIRAGGRAIVLSEGGRQLPRLLETGAMHISFPAATKNPARILANVGSLSKIATAESVHLIHARSRAPAWTALLASRHIGIPFVTTYHGAYSERSRAKNLYNSVMARGDTVIANSEYTAQLIRQRYSAPADHIKVIYRGVEVDRFDRNVIDQSRTQALRAKWHLPETARIVLHPARLTNWKGQKDVIETAARLKGRLGDTVRFVLAGDAQGRADYVRELDQQILKNGLQNCVHMVGHVDDMPAAFATADVAFVASVEPEAFGRAAAEAQAVGCPVISTNIGAPPETVMAPPKVAPGERTGWLVAPGDIDAYVAALTEALALGAQDRAALAQRSRANILSNFTTITMQRKTLAVYDRLIGTKLLESFGERL